MAKLKNGLPEAFKMNDLDETTCCIGLNITRNAKKGELCVNQRRYIMDISRFRMANKV